MLFLTLSFTREESWESFLTSVLLNCKYFFMRHAHFFPKVHLLHMHTVYFVLVQAPSHCWVPLSLRPVVYSFLHSCPGVEKKKKGFTSSCLHPKVWREKCKFSHITRKWMFWHNPLLAVGYNLREETTFELGRVFGIGEPWKHISTFCWRKSRHQRIRHWDSCSACSKGKQVFRLDF